MSTSNPYAPKNINETKAVTKEEKNELEVPAGTVSEVTEWVGEDKERAQAALDTEKNGAERKTLITHLEELLNKE